MPTGEVKDVRTYPNSSGNEWGYLTADGSGQTEIYWRKPGKDLPSIKKGDKVEYKKDVYDMVDPKDPSSKRKIETMIIEKIL